MFNIDIFFMYSGKSGALQVVMLMLNGSFKSFNNLDSANMEALMMNIKNV